MRQVISGVAAGFTGWGKTRERCHSDRSEESLQFAAGCGGEKIPAEIRLPAQVDNCGQLFRTLFILVRSALRMHELLARMGCNMARASLKDGATSNWDVE